jgi:hypothetical protein
MLSPESRSEVATDTDPIWIVPLPRHSHYDHVRLKRVFVDDGTRHVVVMVDAGKLLQCANRDETDYVLKSVDDWHAGKIRGIREFLDPDNTRIPEMPYVTITQRKRRSLMGWFGMEHEGVVAFRNGQHRARYLAYAGAEIFPVEVAEREVDLLISLCGVAQT